MEFGINFFGPIYTEDGIGEAARLTLKCFESLGIKVAVNPLSRPVANEKSREKSEVLTPYSINYFHFSSRWVPYYLGQLGEDILKEKYNIAYWVTEVQNYPNEWAKNYKYFNEIWTASSFCQNSISVKTPIPTILIPHPIVGNKAEKKRVNYFRENKKFKFLVMANMYSDIERKNVLESLEAFKLAFQTEENVSLILKISNPTVDNGYMKKINQYIKADNRIKLFTDFIDRDKINLLFQSVNAYVSLHRAEGFGLTLGEAMYHEIPVITTAYSGNMDFCNSFNSYLVDYDLVRVGENRLRYKKNDLWAQPKLESAIEMFQKVYNDSTDVEQKTKRAKTFIEDNFSVDAVAKKILNRLNIINSNFEFSGSYGEFR